MKDTYLTNALLYQVQAMNTKDQSLLRAFSDSSCRRLSRSFRQWDAGLYWEATVITDRLLVIAQISELESKSWKYATCSSSSFPPDLDSSLRLRVLPVSFMITPITIVLGRIPSVIMTQPVFPVQAAIKFDCQPQGPHPWPRPTCDLQNARPPDMLKDWEKTLWCCHNTLENNFTS